MHATERDWIAATRGNGTADREEFETWALGLHSAPSRRDPRVWEYLITMAEEMEAVERGAYGQAHDDLADDVARGVVARFQDERAYEPNARRRRPSSAPAFRSMLRPNPLPAATRRGQQKRMVHPGDVVTVDMRGLAHNLPPRVDMMVLERVGDTFSGRIVDKSNFAEKIPRYQHPVPFLGTVFHDIPTARVVAAFTPPQDDIDFYLRSYAVNRQPPPPPSALRSARERDRARYGEDEEIPVRPFDPEERVPFGTKPHHFAYPNPRRPVRMSRARAQQIVEEEMAHRSAKITREEQADIESVMQEFGVVSPSESGWYQARGEALRAIWAGQDPWAHERPVEITPMQDMSLTWREGTGALRGILSGARRNPAPPPNLPPARRLLPPKR